MEGEKRRPLELEHVLFIFIKKLKPHRSQAANSQQDFAEPPAGNVYA